MQRNFRRQENSTWQTRNHRCRVRVAGVGAGERTNSMYGVRLCECVVIHAVPEVCVNPYPETIMSCPQPAQRAQMRTGPCQSYALAPISDGLAAA